MVTLVLLGALIPVHVLRGWRSRRNRLAGAAMVIANVLFVATAFGLYYAGSDTWRPWISDVHIAVGVVFPVLIVIHVWTGRRSSPTAEKNCCARPRHHSISATRFLPPTPRRRICRQSRRGNH